MVRSHRVRRRLRGTPRVARARCARRDRTQPTAGRSTPCPPPCTERAADAPETPFLYSILYGALTGGISSGTTRDSPGWLDEALACYIVEFVITQPLDQTYTYIKPSFRAGRCGTAGDVAGNAAGLTASDDSTPQPQCRRACENFAAASETASSAQAGGGASFQRRRPCRPHGHLQPGDDHEW